MNASTREYVRRLVAEAPPLSPARRARIRAIFAAGLPPVTPKPERRTA